MIVIHRFAFLGACVAVLALIAITEATANVQDSSGTFHGRATFYTDNTQGSCRYGTPDTKYYAAWPDQQDGFPRCGNCFEVSCVNRSFRDGYGKTVSRSGACYDESKKIVVKIIDSCPCVHENYYSNQRWCCGDMDHLDISEDAFALLADKKQGVIGVDFKQVSCDKLGPVDSDDSSKDSPRDDNDGKSQQDHGDDKGKDDSSSTSDWIDKKKAEFKKKRDEMSSGKDGFFSKWERPSWVKSMFDDDWRH